jgi:hypothetical protein
MKIFVTFFLIQYLCLAFRFRILSKSKISHLSDSKLENGNPSGNFGHSFVLQKNYILLDKLENPKNGNLTDVAMQYVNFCDESFDIFLNERISALSTEEEKRSLGRVRYEVNCARQRKLQQADQILRGILSAGGLKQMEAKLTYHLRKFEIDMAFMVILQLNIEDAREANSTLAVQVLTHLETMINEYQDTLTSPPVRLLRLLLRTDDVNIRKQMLRQKLLIGNNTLMADGKVDLAKDTRSPQCEHIIVNAVESWGGADVEPYDLLDTITDVLSQVSDCCLGNIYFFMTCLLDVQ